jgi:small-conductance mechanosensitive channel
MLDMNLRAVVTKGIIAILATAILAAPALLCPAWAQPAEPAAAGPEKGAPVVLAGDTIFHIREGLHSFTAQDRAAAVNERIAAVAGNLSFNVKDLAIKEAGDAAYVQAGELLLLTITDNDARSEGKTRLELARARLEQVSAAISAHRARFSTKSILLGILYALLAMAVLIAILILFKRKFPALYRLIESWHGTKIRPVRIQSLELLAADRITGLLIAVAKGVRVLATVLLFYVLAPLILRFLPWTRPYVPRLTGYLIAPFVAMGRGFLSYLPSLAFLVAIAVIAYYAIKLCRVLFLEVEKGSVALPGFDAEWAQPTYKIARFTLLALAAVVAFPYLPGSDSPAFKGISIFLGVLFSLGSTSAVANIVAGLILTYTGAFRVGDRVQIGDTVGDVIARTLVVTRLRTIKNVDVTIPNSTVMGSSVLNYTSEAKERGLILNTSVTIGYDAPWRRVHELLIAAAYATDGILRDPRPFVFQTALNDFYVTYELNAYTDRPAEMAHLYSDLHTNIQDTFNEGGVEIMSPHYAQLRDGNTTTIPEGYRPADYVAPALRITSIDGQEGPGKKD